MTHDEAMRMARRILENLVLYPAMATAEKPSKRGLLEQDQSFLARCLRTASGEKGLAEEVE